MAKSTKVIAALGVAALGVAAIPMSAIHAAEDAKYTDTVTLNVTASCSFSTGGANVNPTATVAAGGIADFGESKTHSFVVNCNKNAYSVTAIATDLVNNDATAHKTIEYSTNAAYEAGLADKGDDGKWTAVLSTGKTDAAIGKTSTVIKDGNSTSTDAFSVEYKAYAGKAQTEGAYTGTVIYTLNPSA